MNLKNYVTSLKESQKLKDIGIKQNSLFYWNIRYFPSKISLDNFPIDGNKYWIFFSAFTLQELLEKLPNQIIIESEVLTLKIHENKLIYSWEDNLDHHFEEGDTLLKAAVKMLIYVNKNLKKKGE